MPPPACAICDGRERVKVFGAWLVGQDTPMCYQCFEVWYDEGQTECAEIRARSLKKQKRFEPDFKI